jgi:hypothetical protein
MRLRLGVLPVSLLLASCIRLDDIPANVCGNGVIDEGEVCDGATGCFSTGSLACLAYDCSAAPCPEGHICGTDGVCRAPTGDLSIATTLSYGYASLQSGDTDGDCSFLLGLPQGAPMGPDVGLGGFGCRLELVGGSFSRNSVEVNFFAYDFALEQQVVLNGSFFGFPPLVANVDGGQQSGVVTSDVLPVTPQGIGLYRGDPSRSFQPEVLDRRPTNVNVAGTFKLAALALPLDPANPAAGICSKRAAFVVPGHGIFDEIGNVVVASDPTADAVVVDMNADGCDELVWSVQGSPEISMQPGYDT